MDHDASGQDLIRINDIYIVGSTDEAASTTGLADVVGSQVVVVDDEDQVSEITYRLRVPIVDVNAPPDQVTGELPSLPHLEGTQEHAMTCKFVLAFWPADRI